MQLHTACTLLLCGDRRKENGYNRYSTGDSSLGGPDVRQGGGLGFQASPLLGTVVKLCTT